MNDARYRLPPDARREGIEGYRALGADGAPAAEVVAVNRTREGLVLLVAPLAEPETLVAVPVALVEALDDRAATVTLRAEALAGPRLDRGGLSVGGAGLVRAIPAELLRLLPPGEAVERYSSSGSLTALVLGVAAGVSLLVAYFAVGALGDGAAWGLLAVPVLLLAASGASLLLGLEGSLADKLRLVPASLFGYTPRER